MQVKKYPKADLNRWSFVFFLAGLFIMLTLSYGLLEWETEENNDTLSEVLDVGDEVLLDIPITEALDNPPPPPPAMVQTVIEVVEDNLDIEESLIESTETNQNSDLVIYEIDEIEEVTEEEDIVFVPFAVIENVPLFPGCDPESPNGERRKCMSDNITAFVQKHFNNELAMEYGLQGLQRINVQFKINRYGKVVDVRARAPHPGLEREALRVINLLPDMTPGKQRGKPVGVVYGLPILFQVELK